MHSLEFPFLFPFRIHHKGDSWWTWRVQVKQPPFCSLYVSVYLLAHLVCKGSNWVCFRCSDSWARTCVYLQDKRPWLLQDTVKVRGTRTDVGFSLPLWASLVFVGSSLFLLSFTSHPFSLPSCLLSISQEDGWLILCINFTGLKDAQRAGKTLFRVCLWRDYHLN